ncbi:hypothetical protein ACWC9Q_31550, partial [Streptomyces sp. NPDC001142]
GLYETPGVAVPYCSVYDTEGREKMGADHQRRGARFAPRTRRGAATRHFPELLRNSGCWATPWPRVRVGAPHRP